MMNIRDFPPTAMPKGLLWSTAGYGLSYTLICLALSVWLWPVRTWIERAPAVPSRAARVRKFPR